MHILKAVKNVPGGLMLVPLLLGALCHTFTPGAGKYFGSFTNGLITGTVPILSVWFFCMGASINYKNAGLVLRKSGTIVVTKIIVAWIVGFICVAFMPKGMIQTGFFAGLSTLAIVTSMDMTNGWSVCIFDAAIRDKRRSRCFCTDFYRIGPSRYDDDPWFDGCCIF